MKLFGKKVSGPNVEVVVLPRGLGDDLVFKCQAVLDMTPFEKLCPRPTPPKKMLKGGVVADDVEDRGYQQQINEYGKSRMAWMILQSLRATDGLEWEMVDYSNRDTWGRYEEELRDAGLAEMEVARIVTGVMIANSLNEERINEARARFFTSAQSTQQSQSSQTDVQSSTPSGGAASDSG